MDNYGIPAEDLIALIAQLRSAQLSPHPSSAELRQYMAGVQQGREQAAQRIEELLTEYGVPVKAPRGV